MICFQAEYDEMLIEYCGELIPVLAEKLGGLFYKYFKSCMPFFFKKMVRSCWKIILFLVFIIFFLQKNKNSTSERSFATGTIAETMEKFDSPMANELAPEIIPKILELTQLVILASNFCIWFYSIRK